MAATIKITGAALTPNPAEVKASVLFSVTIEPEVFEIVDTDGNSIACADGSIIVCAEE